MTGSKRESTPILKIGRDARSVMHAVIAVSFEVGGGENVPSIPAHAQAPILRIW